MKIEGYVTDKNKAPIANALVEIKGENFVTLFSTESKEDGYYVLDIEREIAKHTWQAMHGGTHSCKIYKPLPKQELINRLSGKHPRTPLTQISSVATHCFDAI